MLDVTHEQRWAVAWWGSLVGLQKRTFAQPLPSFPQTPIFYLSSGDEGSEYQLPAVPYSRDICSYSLD